jgi:hypothetical protein
MSEPNDKPVEQGCEQEALWHVMNLPIEVEQPKVGELPPLEVTDEDKRSAKRLDIFTKFNPGRNERRLAYRVICRERQLLAEQQVSAGLRKQSDSWRLLAELHESRREAAEASLAEARAEQGKMLLALNKAAFETVPALEAELQSLRERQEKAWDEGFAAGVRAYADTPGAPDFTEMRYQIVRFHTRPGNPYGAKEPKK